MNKGRETKFFLRVVGIEDRGIDKIYTVVSVISFKVYKLNKLEMLEVYNSNKLKDTVALISRGKVIVRVVNGVESRYPIEREGRYTNHSLTVLGEVLKSGVIVGYQVSDKDGNIRVLSVADAVKYALEEGVSNGGVRVINGKHRIIPIKGKYDTLSIEEAKRKGV